MPNSRPEHVYNVKYYQRTDIRSEPELMQRFQDKSVWGHIPRPVWWDNQADVIKKWEARKLPIPPGVLFRPTKSRPIPIDEVDAP